MLVSRLGSAHAVRTSTCAPLCIARVASKGDPCCKRCCLVIGSARRVGTITFESGGLVTIAIAAPCLSSLGIGCVHGVATTILRAGWSVIVLGAMSQSQLADEAKSPCKQAGRCGLLLIYSRDAEVCWRFGVFWNCVPCQRS